MKNKTLYLFIIDVLIAILMLSACSKITDPGAVVEAPSDNGIAVFGFTGSACTNCHPSLNIVWYDIVIVEDKGSNVHQLPDRINLAVNDKQLEQMFALKPHRTVLVATKASNYWKLVHIGKN